MTHILAVDDDPEVLATLGRVLMRADFTTTLVSSGKEALDYLKTNEPSLMILDVMMPGMSGIDVCHEVRRDYRLVALPVLFLTAKGSTEDIVAGLDAGGDDYVVKPFELEELYARIQALLRRKMRIQNLPTTLQLDDMVLDVDNYQVIIGSEPILLTATECRLLRYFMEHIDQALSLTHLLQHVWDYPDGVGDPDLVRAHVRNLRIKMESHSERRYIHTVHGIGYIMPRSAT